MTAIRALEASGRPDRHVQDELEIREATEDDLDAIRALYVAIGNEERNRSYDRWRFFSGPYGICPSILAMDGDRAAGFYTVWPVKLRLGKEVVMGAQSMDTMTHPDYRGRGVFLTLAEACYELAASKGYEVLYGFPNRNSYPGFIRRLNWDHTGDITHWVRPIRPSRHKNMPAAIGPFADMAAALLPRGRVANVQISFTRPEAAALQVLLDQWCDEPDICRIERTGEWIDWRYTAEAEKDFEWVCAYRNGALIAAGVWGMENTAWGGVVSNRARIGELLGQDRQGKQAVLAAIIGRAKARGASLVETMCNVGPVVASLKRAGFFRYQALPLITRSLTARILGGNIHNHAAWRIMGGDWDVT